MFQYICYCLSGEALIDSLYELNHSSLHCTRITQTPIRDIVLIKRQQAYCHGVVKVCHCHKVIKMFLLIFAFGLFFSNGVAIECNLNGLCEGHFLGSQITLNISDCIFYCRQTKVNKKQRMERMSKSCHIFLY